MFSLFGLNECQGKNIIGTINTSNNELDLMTPLVTHSYI